MDEKIKQLHSIYASLKRVAGTLGKEIYNDDTFKTQLGTAKQLYQDIIKAGHNLDVQQNDEIWNLITSN